ncbi:MAG: sugar phosphate isomerase/epimerase [Pirellulales bacterium]|nr:sugar phosphate isomerase/epimerase [Pirellulales bacterium]
MIVSRRTFLQAGAVGLAGAAWPHSLWAAESAAEKSSKIHVSAREGSFGGNFEIAARCHLDGVELGINKPAEKLPIADAAARKKTKEQLQALGLAVSSLSLNLMNNYPMVSEPRAPAWLEQTIEAAKDFGTRGILVPFFGKGELKPEHFDELVVRMKAAAPLAAAAGVVLGLENWLSAEQNLKILDRIGSDAVRVYYDVGNSTLKGYDVPAELRRLKGRLCMIHFKDGANYLGEGKVEMPPIAKALKELDYRGWIVLETSCPSKNPEADCKRNATFVRKLLGLADKAN